MECPVYNNVEAVLRNASSGRLIPTLALLSYQSAYYFWALYTPFSSLYFGSLLGLSALLSVSSIGSALYRFSNIASLTLLPPNKVRLVGGDGSRKEIAVSDIKAINYYDSGRPPIGHVV